MPSKRSIYIFSDGELKRQDNTLWLIGEDTKRAIPVETVEDLYIYGEVSINKRLLEFLTRIHIPIHFFNHYEYYVGSYYPREYLNSGYLVLRQAACYLDENERLGIPYPAARTRRTRLDDVGAALKGAGIETWIGAGTRATNELAHSIGVTLNLWGAQPDRVREIAATGAAVSWAGPFPKDDSGPELLESLSRAGATWAVWGWPPSVESVVSAAQRARIELASAAR
jgi:hypothetical protein